MTAPPDLAPMLTTKRFLILTLVCIALFGLALAIGPRVAPEDQDALFVRNVYLPGPFGLTINGDSGDFLNVAHDPSLLLGETSIRQSRPGMLVLAYLISRPLLPLSYLESFLPITLNHQRSSRYREFFALLPEFVAYLLINIALLWAGVWMLTMVWGNQALPFSLACVAWLVVVNDINKAFFWSPHSQLFNLFVPLFVLYLAVQAWDGEFFHGRRVLWLALGAGLGMTAYATFIIALPVLLFFAFIHNTKPLSAFLVRAVLISAIILTPMVAWMGLVVSINGHFYSPETVVYRQVVWIFDHDPLTTAGMLISNFGQILSGFVRLNPYLLGMGCVVGLFVLLKQRPILRHEPVVTSALFSALMFAAFFSVVGFILDRLINTLFPLLVAILGVGLIRLLSLYPKQTLYIHLASWVSFGVWCVYTITKYGPYN